MPNNTQERPSASHALDAAGARRAHMRAIAAGLVDGPRIGRRFHVPAGVALQPSPRRRSHASRRRPTVERRRHRPVARRLVGAAFLLAQVGVLAALLTAPAFRVGTIDVSGERLLSRQAVLAAARIPHSSLFTLDGNAIESRLAQLSWVRTATVTTQLPSTIRIDVTEWQPDVLLRHGAGAAFVAANGATLPLTPSTSAVRKGIPLLLDYRSGPQQTLQPGLAGLLASAAQRWPAVFGCSVDAFVLSSSNVLSVWSSTGWQAVFGAIDGGDALAALPEQIAVLAALKVRLDFVHPTFGYVDLENPAAPAIGGKPGEPAELRSAIAGGTLPTSPPEAVIEPPVAVSPTPVPSPTATPAPTPVPTPSAAVFSLAPPSPSAHR